MAQDQLQIFNLPEQVEGLEIIYNALYALTANSIYFAQTGAMIDIYNEYDYVPPRQTLIAERGANEKSIKIIWGNIRKISQIEEKDSRAKNYENKKYYHELKKILLDIILNLAQLIEAYDNFSKIYLFELKKDIISKDKVIVSHPYIKNIEKEIKNLVVELIGALLNKQAQLIVSLYQSSLTKTQAGNIMSKDKYLDKAVQILLNKKIVRVNSSVCKYVKQEYNDFMNRLVKIRNKLEHPSSEQFVKINNFYLLPNGLFAEPTIDINIAGFEKSSSLIEEVSFLYNHFLEFVADFINLIVEEKFSTSISTH